MGFEQEKFLIMIPALLTFLGFCAALFCWLWERLEGTEYDD